MTILEELLFAISKKKMLTNMFIADAHRTKKMILIKATAMNAMANPPATLLILFLLIDTWLLLA
ncbi:MAG: hypothetical protein M3250_01145 [Thermoproteota archaeon]|nr:hypothetical protein [Thermoproteota archaeon]